MVEPVRSTWPVTMMLMLDRGKLVGWSRVQDGWKDRRQGVDGNVDLDCGFWDCDWDGQERRLLSVLGVSACVRVCVF